jgi:hypothetical protein
MNVPIKKKDVIDRLIDSAREARDEVVRRKTTEEISLKEMLRGKARFSTEDGIIIE